jgi:hypothetical protein
MERTRGRAADGVAIALQRYADRGVFRGLSVTAGRGGRQNFSFTWLTRRPMSLTFEPKRGALVFKDLLPGVGANRALVSDLKAIVDDHAGSGVPAHRRLDARRLRAACAVRGGHLTLSLQVRGQHHEYAVQRGLNLVNQLFLLLQASYPEYLIEQFGFSAE